MFTLGVFRPHSLQSCPIILERVPGRCQPFGAQQCTAGAFPLCWGLGWTARCPNRGGPGPSDLVPALLLSPLRVPPPPPPVLPVSTSALGGDPRLSRRPWVQLTVEEGHSWGCTPHPESKLTGVRRGV